MERVCSASGGPLLLAAYGRGNGASVSFVKSGLSSFSKLQGLPELKVGHAKIFNFSPKTYKLSDSISRDSGDSPDSNHTKCVNYECLDLKEIGVMFPSLRDA